MPMSPRARPQTKPRPRTSSPTTKSPMRTNSDRNSHGLTIQNIQSVLSQQNAHEPTGQTSDETTTADIVTNDQISHADQFRSEQPWPHNSEYSVRIEPAECP